MAAATLREPSAILQTIRNAAVKSKCLPLEAVPTRMLGAVGVRHVAGRRDNNAIQLVWVPFFILPLWAALFSGFFRFLDADDWFLERTGEEVGVFCDKLPILIVHIAPDKLLTTFSVPKLKRGKGERRRATEGSENA